VPLVSLSLYERLHSRPYGLRCDLTVPNFLFPRSSSSLRLIFLMVFLTQLTTVLYAESRVTCYSFRCLCLCFNQRSNPWRSWLFMFESVTLHVDSLYTKVIVAVKLRAVLSTSSSELISILSDITSEARFWNFSQPMNFSAGSKRFLFLTWSSMWNAIGRRSESRLSETITFDNLIFWWTTMPSSSQFPAGE
jgi:hypothetical protein